MDEVEQIKQKISIVDFIGEYIPVKKSGINFKANCPFHNEKTPSFMISPERGVWHCFGCDRGGDLFKFLMEKEGIEFKDALEILAQKAGVVLQKSSKKDTDVRDQLFLVNQKAAQFFHYLLTEHKLGKNALEYLHKRGLNDATIKKFELGYAPLSWETLTKFLKKRGFKLEDLINSGLCVASQHGCYDRFRGRVMFPLKDVRERIIGFSGRILDQGEPKYINTPQTLIFDKRRFLLGLHITKGEIKSKNEAIIVEGEMDMLMSYQSGVKNIVASKGTALTEEQIEALKKYTETISLCFDTDLAGDAAARRGIEMADRAGFNIKIIKPEGAKDPAEVVLSDPDKWVEAVKNATPIYDYYLDSAQKRFNIKDAADKKAIFAELLPIWKKIADPIVKEHYINRLAALLQIKDEFVRKELEKVGTPSYDKIQINPQVSSVRKTDGEPMPAPVQKHAVSTDRRGLLEEYLISLLLHIPAGHTYIPNFPETLFTQENLKQVYVLLVIFLDSISFKGAAFNIKDFIAMIPAEHMPLIDRLYLMQLDENLENGKNWQKEIDTVVAELKKMLIKASLEKLSLQIKSAQEFNNGEALTTLNKRFRDLSVRLRNL